MSEEINVKFFIGKGGVGKTTMAAAYSFLKAKEGLKVLVVSLDPAHNLGDVLNVKLKEEPKEVFRNLWASEVDYEGMVKKYMNSLANEVKDIYGYLKIFNLEGYVDTLKYSPGIEEHATLEKIKEILVKNWKSKNFDIIVFDTPPTGLTVRIMALPKVTLIWLEKLMELRLAILGRRKMLERALDEKLKIKVGDKELTVATAPEEDRIYTELSRMKEETEWVNKIFTNSSTTSVTIVVNPEVLSVLEAERAANALKTLSIPLEYLIINKVMKALPVNNELGEVLKQQSKAMEIIKTKFPGLSIIEIPYFPWEPVGFDKLEVTSKYLADFMK